MRLRDIVGLNPNEYATTYPFYKPGYLGLRSQILGPHIHRCGRCWLLRNLLTQQLLAAECGDFDTSTT